MGTIALVDLLPVCSAICLSALDDLLLVRLVVHATARGVAGAAVGVLGASFPSPCVVGLASRCVFPHALCPPVHELPPHGRRHAPPRRPRPGAGVRSSRRKEEWLCVWRRALVAAPPVSVSRDQARARPPRTHFGLLPES